MIRGIARKETAPVSDRQREPAPERAVPITKRATAELPRVGRGNGPVVDRRHLRPIQLDHVAATPLPITRAESEGHDPRGIWIHRGDMTHCRFVEVVVVIV